MEDFTVISTQKLNQLYSSIQLLNKMVQSNQHSTSLATQITLDEQRDLIQNIKTLIDGYYGT